VSESATREPIVIDTIERYLDLLQGHVSAQQMLENVLTDDFETGFADGFRWRGADGLTEFLGARSVFFDESHDVLQLINVTNPDVHTIQAQTRLRFFLRRPRTRSRDKRGIHRSGVAHLASAARTG
jgi:hypothetical protein